MAHLGANKCAPRRFHLHFRRCLMQRRNSATTYSSRPAKFLIKAGRFGHTRVTSDRSQTMRMLGRCCVHSRQMRRFRFAEVGSVSMPRFCHRTSLSNSLSAWPNPSRSWCLRLTILRTHVHICWTLSWSHDSQGLHIGAPTNPSSSTVAKFQRYAFILERCRTLMATAAGWSSFWTRRPRTSPNT